MLLTDWPIASRFPSGNAISSKQACNSSVSLLLLLLLLLFRAQERKLSMDQLAIKPQALAEMIRLIEDTTISGKIAKDILPELLEGKGNAGVKVCIKCGEV